jgi:hypothetical protein
MYNPLIPASRTAARACYAKRQHRIGPEGAPANRRKRHRCHHRQSANPDHRGHDMQCPSDNDILHLEPAGQE